MKEDARRVEEQRIKTLEEERRKEKERREKEAERQRNEEKRILFESYNEVKELFTQQQTQIRDSRGVRWIKCELCGKILPADSFSTYGGVDHINLGKCCACADKQR